MPYAHDGTLQFDYETVERARVVERSVRQEVDEIGNERSRTTVEREGATVTVTVLARDLVALRAGLNTWLTLVSIAESCSKPDLTA